METMKISSISFLLLLWISCAVSDDGAPGITALGNTILPFACNAYNAGAVPSIIKAIYDTATDETKCKLLCTRPMIGGYYFEAGCDVSKLSVDDKGNFCQMGLRNAGVFAKLFGCETLKCVPDAEGKLIFSTTCPPAPISVA